MLEQFRGCLLALACGESLAAGSEGRSESRLPGTAQMLCVLASYCEAGAFDPHDIAERLGDWFRTAPAGISPMTRAAGDRLLQGYNFERASHDAWLSLAAGRRQDCDCLVRVVPAALFRYFDNIHLVGESRVICSITHFDELCRFCCAVLNIAVAHLMLIGVDGLLDELLEFCGPRNAELTETLRVVPTLRPGELSSRNFVLDGLQSAVWASLYCESVVEGIEILARRVQAPPAVCAVAAAALGARFGAQGLPADWPGALQQYSRVDAGARRLYALAMAE